MLLLLLLLLLLLPGPSLDQHSFLGGPVHPVDDQDTEVQRDAPSSPRHQPLLDPTWIECWHRPHAVACWKAVPGLSLGTALSLTTLNLTPHLCEGDRDGQRGSRRASSQGGTIGHALGLRATSPRSTVAACEARRIASTSPTRSGTWPRGSREQRQLLLPRGAGGPGPEAFGASGPRTAGLSRCVSASNTRRATLKPTLKSPGTADSFPNCLTKRRPPGVPSATEVLVPVGRPRAEEKTPLSCQRGSRRASSQGGTIGHALGLRATSPRSAVAAYPGPGPAAPGSNGSSSCPAEREDQGQVSVEAGGPPPRAGPSGMPWGSGPPLPAPQWRPVRPGASPPPPPLDPGPGPAAPGSNGSSSCPAEREDQGQVSVEAGGPPPRAGPSGMPWGSGPPLPAPQWRPVRPGASPPPPPLDPGPGPAAPGSNGSSSCPAEREDQGQVSVEAGGPPPRAGPSGMPWGSGPPLPAPQWRPVRPGASPPPPPLDPGPGPAAPGSNGSSSCPAEREDQGQVSVEAGGPPPRAGPSGMPWGSGPPLPAPQWRPVRPGASPPPPPLDPRPGPAAPGSNGSSSCPAEREDQGQVSVEAGGPPPRAGPSGMPWGSGPPLPAPQWRPVRPGASPPPPPLDPGPGPAAPGSNGSSSCPAEREDQGQVSVEAGGPPPRAGPSGMPWGSGPPLPAPQWRPVRPGASPPPPPLDPGPGPAAPGSNGSSSCPAEREDQGQVSVEAGGPPPRAGPSGMPWGSGPPLPAPQWRPVRPGASPPPPPLDPGPGPAAPGSNGSSSCPEEREDQGQVSVEAGGPPPRAGPSGMPWGSGPPLPAPQWRPVRPGASPPPPPLDPGPGPAAPGSNGSSSFPAEREDQGQVSVEAGGPPPRAGPSGMPWGSGPPLPAPQWRPVRPGAPPPPPPLDPGPGPAAPGSNGSSSCPAEREDQGQAVTCGDSGSSPWCLFLPKLRRPQREGSAWKQEGLLPGRDHRAWPGAQGHLSPLRSGDLCGPARRLHLPHSIRDLAPRLQGATAAPPAPRSGRTRARKRRPPGVPSATEVLVPVGRPRAEEKTPLSCQRGSRRASSQGGTIGHALGLRATSPRSAVAACEARRIASTSPTR
ncbi:basic proline-rich protein-like [Diceros bicornis minor]|uniref:basic proline-rich protein-like n=1 Tax=Diceros bicornis minor TaxID=77932 RepID=UPI0026EA2ABE|nr:basic proline-rich protein-like [Diceros bicornis minor]